VGLEGESSISEISILPDGRLCIFGTSIQILELLDAIPLGDPALQRRIKALRLAQARLAVESSGPLSVQNDNTMVEAGRTVTT